MRQSLIVLLSLLLLLACTDGGEMRRELQALQDRNAADSLLHDDTLALRLTDYFDRHGTSNEQILSHYLLARTYTDMGRAPEALEQYHNTIDLFNASSKDSVAYHIANRAYCNLGGLFYDNNVPDEALKAYKKAYEYALACNERNIAINLYSQRISCYSQLNQIDSMVSAAEKSVEMFLETGDTTMANTCMGCLLCYYFKNGKTDDARFMLRQFEHHSLFNEKFLTLYPQWQIIYIAKGLSCFYDDKLDSALFYYYKELQLSTTYNNKMLAYQELCYTYRKLSVNDSVSKYAFLYASTRDSLDKTAATAALQGMEYLYQNLNGRKSDDKYSTGLTILAICIFILIAMIACQHFIRIRRYRNMKSEDEIRLLDSESLAAIREKASKGMTISNEEWNRLYCEFKNINPYFFYKLDSLNYAVDDIELKICVLVRLNFQMKDISNLLAISISALSKRRARLLHKISNKSGSSTDFDKMIKEL